MAWLSKIECVHILLVIYSLCTFIRHVENSITMVTVSATMLGNWEVIIIQVYNFKHNYHVATTW